MKAAGAGIVGTGLVASPLLAQTGDGKSAVRWGFLMDASRCKGCLACVVACKTEWDVPLGAFRCAVKDYEYGSYPKTRRTFIPTVCNQCDKPGCVEACPTDVVDHEFTDAGGATIAYKDKAATFKRPDGIVEMNPQHCTGCGKCLDGCPYGVRFRHERIKAGDPPEGKELEAVDKCNWCAHRLKEGVVPSCVNTCPGKARLIGNLNDPNSEISKRLAEHKDDVQVLLESKGTSPQCFYIGVEVKNLDKAFRDGTNQRDQYDLES